MHGENTLAYDGKLHFDRCSYHYPAIRNWPTTLFESRIANSHQNITSLYSLDESTTSPPRSIGNYTLEDRSNPVKTVHWWLRLVVKTFCWESSFHSRDKNFCSLQRFVKDRLNAKMSNHPWCSSDVTRSVWARVPVAVSTVHVRVRLLWPWSLLESWKNVELVVLAVGV